MKPIVKKIIDFFEQQRLDFELIEHEQSFTAQDEAHSIHSPGKEVMKACIIKGEGRFYMCVMPAVHRVDFRRLEDIIHCKGLELATEEEMKELFPDCELGAEPPFGTWYGLAVFVDPSLADNDFVYFKAGTHNHSIRMRFDDWEELTNPKAVNCWLHLWN